MKAIKLVDKIVSDDTLFLKNKFNLDVNEINRKLSKYIVDPFIS